MNELDDLAARLRDAGDLPDVLAAAHAAFDTILRAIRGREDPATGMFAALVLAAGLAADGRDAISRAPSLPLTVLGAAGTGRPAGEAGASVAGLAFGIAGLAALLAGALHAAGDRAGAGDREACAEAARCAREIRGLLSGGTDG